MATPTVSVLIPAYNHEKYIAKTIESVLAQTFSDFELLIFDDCSTDGTASEIKRFTDKRIEAIFSSQNRGTVFALNTLIEKAKGEYIAVIGSDDVWLPQKLEKQLAYLKEHSNVAACFTRVLVIDENSEEMLSSDTFPLHIFDVENKEHNEWLRYSYLSGNHLCHSSVLIRREAHQEIGVYRPAFRQLHDFDLWLRLLLKHEIHILEEKLVGYRVVSADNNLSKNTDSNNIRLMTEAKAIFEELFDKMDDGTFRQCFAPLFRNKNAQTREELMCERFFLLFDNGLWGHCAYGLAAHQLFYSLDADVVACLEKTYGMTLREFYDFTGECFDENARALKEQNEALKAELTELLSSTSWRLTAPLRKMKRLFSKKGKG